MSRKLKSVAFAAVALTSLLVVAAEPEAQSSQPISTAEQSSRKPESVKAQNMAPAPVLWDALDPKTIDKKAVSQRKQSTLPKPMPAEFK